MHGLIYVRASAPKPPVKYFGTAVGNCLLTSPLRLDLILWYTSGFK